MIPSKLNTLGDHIRKVRIERGQYQPELAKIFKVTTDTVTNWELNRNKIGRIYLPIIEEYLGYLPTEYDLTDLAKQLIRYRWEQRLTIKQLAEKLEVYHNCLQNIETGKLNIKNRTLKNINKFFIKSD